MGKNIDKRVWGVLGKQQTYFSPQKQVEGKTKVPLNANAFDSWDAKRSNFKRIDGYNTNDAAQQGGTVIGQSTTPVPSSTPQPTPSSTPQPTTTPSTTPTTTPTPTPSATPEPCVYYTLAAGGSGSNFYFTNCDNTPGTIYLSGSSVDNVCALRYSVSYDGGGAVFFTGDCPVWNNNTTNWESETDNWEDA